MPFEAWAACMSGKNMRGNGAVSGLKITATDRTSGTISLRSSIHLPPMLGSSAPKPVSVSAGAGETLHEASRNRVGNRNKNNRDSAGHLPGQMQIGRGVHDKHIWS
jgi:hypothetical protein